MTLVLTINGPEAIWVLTDRRLSSKGKPVKEEARKVMFLETTDGVAILGYCGLGATLHGTEPADWMSGVLRGRNLPLEQSLGALADAIKRQLPRHVPKGFAHTVIAPAFLGEQLKLYSIKLGPNHEVIWRHWPVDKRPWQTARVAMGGSGGIHLSKHKNKKEWVRGVLRMIKAHDRGQVSALAVADQLARINNGVSLDIADESVGPRCIVAWRYRKDDTLKRSGSHQFYTGTARDISSPSIPTIAGEFDVNAIIGVMTPHLNKIAQARKAGEPIPEPEWDEEFALLPTMPDELLK